MRLKTVAEDFFVEEQLDYPFQPTGEFTIYRIRKRNLTTPQAIRRLASWIGVPLRRIAHAGMKDRRAETVQYLSLQGTGPEHIALESLTAERVGYGKEKLSARHLLGNRFRLVLRDLTQEEVEIICRNLPVLQEIGFPNYFDDQRFSAPIEPKQAFGFHLFRRDFAAALKAFFREHEYFPNVLSPNLLETILNNWGDWDLLAKTVRSRRWHPIFKYLSQNPQDYQGAVFKISYPDLRIRASAAQSYLWNELLACLIRNHYGPQVVELPGYWQNYVLIRPSEIQPESFQRLNGLKIALPHPEFHSPVPELTERLQQLLTELGMAREQLCVPYLRKFHVETHERPAVVRPVELTVSEPTPDERHPGKKQMELAFSLPPGSYATMLMKQLLVG